MKLSVVVPCLNGADEIRACAQNILMRLYEEDQLILVDDGSTDRTFEQMQTLAQEDKRVKALRLPSNKGIPSALNAGFDHSTQECLSWTSVDNQLSDDWRDIFETAFAENPEADVLYSDYHLASAQDTEFQVNKMGPTDRLRWENCVGASFLFRASMWRNLRYDPSLHLIEDYDFWYRAFMSGYKFVHISGAPYKYIAGARSLSIQKRRTILFRLFIYQLGKPRIILRLSSHPLLEIWKWLILVLPRAIKSQIVNLSGTLPKLKGAD